MRAIASLLLALITLTGGAHAQSSTADAVRAAELAREAAEADREAENLAQRLATMGLAITAQERALSQLRDSLIELTKQEKQAAAEVDKQRQSGSALLGALQSISRAPKASLLAHPDAPLDSARGALAMTSLLSVVEKKARILSTALNKLREIREQRVLALVQAQEAIEYLSRSRAEAKVLLSQRRAESAAARAAAAELHRRIAEAARVSADLQTLSAAIQAPLGSAPTLVAPGADLALSMPELPQGPPFDNPTTKVAPPVAATIAGGFGDIAPDGRKLKGVLLEADAGAQVLAPWSGEIRYAGPFLHYRNIVILEPEEDYLIVLAGLARVDREMGERVLSGEPVGVLEGEPVPASDILTGEKPVRDRRETLYMEVRRKGRPVDPAAWFEFSQTKVSGL